MKLFAGEQHKDIEPVLLAKVYDNQLPFHILRPSEAQTVQTQMAEEALAENVRPGGKVLVFFCMIPWKAC